MRLSTEHNGCKIKEPFPFAEQREMQSIQGGGQDRTGGVMGVGTKLIPLEC